MEPTRGKGTIRVLLVDDHAMVRQGLRSILTTYPEFEVVGEATDGQEALQAVHSLMPSVVVMDIYMPRLVVGLSVYANEDTHKAMTAVGATTVISKETAVEHLRDEIIDSVNRRSSAFH